MRRYYDELANKRPDELAAELEKDAEVAEKRAAREEIYECFSELRFQTARGFDKFMLNTPSPGVDLHWRSGVLPSSVFWADFSTTDTNAFESGQPFRLKVTVGVSRSGKTVGTATTTINVLGIPRFALISSVTLGGSQQNPSIVVHGTNLGSKPAPNPSGSPSNQPLCPVVIKGNVGLDYGTSLYLNDNTGNFAAGRYRPTVNELDCIGLIVTKFTPTEVDFRPGSGYQQFSPKYQINDGDAIEVAVNGASKTVHVKYGTAVSS